MLRSARAATEDPSFRALVAAAVWLAVPGSGYGDGGTVKIKSRLTVAADATYPPNEFIGPDGQRWPGWIPNSGMRSAR